MELGKIHQWLMIFLIIGIINANCTNTNKEKNILNFSKSHFVIGKPLKSRITKMRENWEKITKNLIVLVKVRNKIFDCVSD